MKSPKTKKVVRGWALTDKRDHTSIYAAYTDQSEARATKNEAPTYHRNDVVIPCLIILPTKKSAGKVGKKKAV